MAINSIQTFTAAQLAQTNVSRVGQLSANSIARLSSGERIVNAADDVAAMASGTTLQTRVTSIRANLLNASQGGAMLQIADGALQEITSILQRQKTIATQASSGALTDVERGFLNQEFQALSAEIDRIEGSTSFNGTQVFGGGKIDVRINSNINTPVNVLNIETNQYRFGIGSGRLRFVDAGGNVLTVGAERDGINPEIHGAITNIKLSDVEYGIAGRISADINGRTFTGIIEHRANNVIVSNGNDYVQLGTAQFRMDNDIRAATSLSRLQNDMHPLRITRRTDVSAIDLSGTRLEGFNFRSFLDSYTFSNSVSIENFRYLGDTGANNSAILAVDIDGQTFTTRNAPDALRNNRLIRFFGEVNLERFDIRIGRIEPIGQGGVPNIRENEAIRKEFIDALNIGYSRATNATRMGISDNAENDLDLKLDRVNTLALYAGQSLNVGSAATATVASDQLDYALNFVTRVRADAGAAQSRINFASASLQTSLQNQDAARAGYQDTDIASESTAFAGAQVKLQAGLSALAQANLLAAGLLDLIAPVQQ